MPYPIELQFLFAMESSDDDIVCIDCEMDACDIALCVGEESHNGSPHPICGLCVMVANNDCGWRVDAKDCGSDNADT